MGSCEAPTEARKISLELVEPAAIQVSSGALQAHSGGRGPILELWAGTHSVAMKGRPGAVQVHSGTVVVESGSVEAHHSGWDCQVMVNTSTC